MSPEPQIIKTEDIIVKSTTKDNYGNLIVTSAEGKEYRVSKKRESLFSFFEPTANTHLQWAIYQNREYIANAFPTDRLVKGRPVKETPGEVKPEVKQDKPVPQGGYLGSSNASIEQQVAVKAVVELAVNGKIEMESSLMLTAKNWIMSKLGNWSSMGEVKEVDEPDESDITTLTGALKFLEKKQPKKWGHLVVASRLFTTYNVTGDTIKELIADLSAPQLKEFTNIVSTEVIKEKGGENGG